MDSRPDEDAPQQRFEIEQYELHFGTHEVEATSAAEAVRAVLNGDGEMLHGDYIGPCHEVGMVVTPELAQQLSELGIKLRKTTLPSIRSVRVVKPVAAENSD